jgi:hypothetical protein
MKTVVYARAPVSERQLRHLRWLAALCTALPVGAVAVLLAHGVDLWAKWGWDDWAVWLGTIALAPWFPALARLQTRGRLTITDEGMAFDARLPPALAWLNRVASWSGRWEQITGVVVNPLGGGIARFTVPGRAFSIHVPLHGWMPEHLAAAGAEAAKPKGVEDSPVWQALAARGLTAQKGRTMVDFDLVQHPATRAALVVTGLLGLGGLLSIGFESEAYIADGYGFLVPHLVAGACGIALFWLVLRRVRAPARLPAGIPVGVAVFGGMAAALFSYGGLVSLNRVAVPALPQTYAIGEPCTTLLPADPALPRIIWSTGFTDYWCSFERGSKLEVPVRRGLFGTWQFDQGAFVDRIHEHRNAGRRH